MSENVDPKKTIEQAITAFDHGYQPIPIRGNSKRPYGGSWTNIRHTSREEVSEAFTEWTSKGATNLGLLLGEPSNGLVDIDLDHHLASRLKDYFLPPTMFKSGRPSRPSSHYWYRVNLDDEDSKVPGTRRYKLPDGTVTVELRSTASQTVIPPSWHPDGEPYLWENLPWAEPTEVSGKVLALQVALLGMTCVLLDNWPKQGSRHDAYLALAGGLLRKGNSQEIHSYWETNLPKLISALADVTHDEDGGESRVDESMGTTITNLRDDRKVVGFPRLGEYIGDEHARQVRRMAKEVESLSGWTEVNGSIEVTTGTLLPDEDELSAESTTEALGEDEDKDPLEQRNGGWDSVNLETYLTGQLGVPEPTMLRRADGRGLMYPGRVNALYGKSESAKSWVALVMCLQEIDLGERVVYMDFEDEPAGTTGRLRKLGAGVDDIRHQFTYLRPDEQMADMQWSRFGEQKTTPTGISNQSVLHDILNDVDPNLIIVDGMTVLYGLHGLDSNDAASTEHITHWLKKLTRHGRSTVVIIDHTRKNAVKGAEPLGSQHKLAMVQGSALQVVPIEQPRPGYKGNVELVVGKDRPGEVREHSTDDDPPSAANVILDSRDKERTLVSIDLPLTNTVPLGHSEKDDYLLASLGELENKIVYSFGGDLDLWQTRQEIEHNIKLDKSKRAMSSALSGLVTQSILIDNGEATTKKRFRLNPEGLS